MQISRIVRCAEMLVQDALREAIKVNVYLIGEILKNNKKDERRRRRG